MVPSHRGSPIVDVCYIYIPTYSLPLLPPPTHRFPHALRTGETDAPILPASSVDTFDTKAFLHFPAPIARTLEYQEINRRFVRILYYTVERNRTHLYSLTFRCV